jgi:hypothetical protein
MILHKFLAINTYQLFYYDFPKFLAKGVLSTTTIFEKYQTTDFCSGVLVVTSPLDFINNFGFVFIILIIVF